MKTHLLRRSSLLLALAIGLLSAFTVQADQKPISTAVCQPYTSTPVDPALLRIRADGITNDYDTSKFVICPLPKDAEVGWSADYYREINVWFRRFSGSPLTSNQCTLTAGWNGNDPLQSVTLYAQQLSSTYGVISFDNSTGPNAVDEGYAVLVCRIAPSNKMDLIGLYESDN